MRGPQTARSEARCGGWSGTGRGSSELRHAGEMLTTSGKWEGGRVAVLGRAIEVGIEVFGDLMREVFGRAT